MPMSSGICSAAQKPIFRHLLYVRNTCRRDQKSLPCVKGGGFCRRQKTEGLPIPQSAPQTAPFTQGGLCSLQMVAECAILRSMKARGFYDKDTFRLPWQDLTQARHTKLYNAIPPFATGFSHLYYSHTTFENNHLLPQHDTK